MANKANLMNIYTPKSQLIFVNHPVATPNAFNMYDYIIGNILTKTHPTSLVFNPNQLFTR